MCGWTGFGLVGSSARCGIGAQLKTVAADTQAVLARLDAKTRLATGIARRFEWRVRRVVPCLVVADSRTNRRRISVHQAAFEGYFDGWRRPAADMPHVRQLVSASWTIRACSA